MWPARYSPADRPSSTRAAPAKNRSWSSIGGISSLRVSASGLPVFSHSTAMISSARASTASANLQQGALPLARSGVPPALERGAGRLVGAVHVLGAGQWRGEIDLTGGGVEHVQGAPVGGRDLLPVDKIGQ